MSTTAAPLPASPTAAAETRRDSTRSLVLIGVLTITAAGAALRFSTLGLQSYHHDEVITVMRVLRGDFGQMLEAVKSSESNPPLYYVLAWFWAKLFGTGEVGLRSLSALFGAATVPVGYLIGRQLAGWRTGLVLSAMLAANPMLIWYSQEARSYAPLVFFGALSLLFFVRALDSRAGRDLGLWALFSALALLSHYFAFFVVGIEGLWLLLALRDRWRAVLPALAAVAAVGLALLPLLFAQVNPNHIGWIENSPLGERFWETAVSFTIGETGHVIAEPPRERYAIVPLLLLGAGALLVAFFGNRRERRGAGLALVLGIGVAGLAWLAALIGKDYVVERNLLPALIPLAAVAAIGFAGRRTYRLGVLLAVALCAYWVTFDIHVTQTPNLQRPNFRVLTQELGSPAHRRAVVSWKLAGDSIRWYLHDGALRMYGGEAPIREVDVLSKPGSAGDRANLPRSFRPVQTIRLDRLTLTRFVSPKTMRLRFATIDGIPTGFGANAVVIDAPPSLLPTLGSEARTTPTGPEEEG
ncbi:MAG TPA: glycosyltransferase family 39 protein [Solirubrobacterales bacterium]|nr:glycosyltransferase family 39 protein [Solirubrobacterales bacterium]